MPQGSVCRAGPARRHAYLRHRTDRDGGWSLSGGKWRERERVRINDQYFLNTPGSAPVEAWWAQNHCPAFLGTCLPGLFLGQRVVLALVECLLCVWHGATSWAEPSPTTLWWGFLAPLCSMAWFVTVFPSCVALGSQWTSLSLSFII